MKKTKSVLLMLFILTSSLFVKGQTVIDTSRVPVMYVSDSTTFATKTGWANKITTYEFQFLQQPAPTGVDSFVVKKTKVPIKQEYYLNEWVVLVKGYKLKPLWVLFEFKKP